MKHTKVLILISMLGSFPTAAATLSANASVTCTTTEQYIQQQNADGSHLTCSIGNSLMADAVAVMFTRYVSASAQVYGSGYTYASAHSYSGYQESMTINGGSGDGIFTAHYEVSMYDVNDFNGPLEAMVQIWQGTATRTIQQAGNNSWQVYISTPFTYGVPFGISIQASAAAFSPGSQAERASVALLGMEYDGKHMVSASGQVPEPGTLPLVSAGMLAITLWVSKFRKGRFHA